MGDSPGGHGRLLGAPPAFAGPPSISEAYCQRAKGKDHAPSGAPALALYLSPASRRPIRTQLCAPNSRASGPLFLQPCARSSREASPVGLRRYERAVGGRRSSHSVTQRIVSWGRSRDGSEFARGNRSVDTEGFCKSQMTLNSGLRWLRATLRCFRWNGRNSVPGCPRGQPEATLRPCGRQPVGTPKPP